MVRYLGIIFAFLDSNSILSAPGWNNEVLAMRFGNHVVRGKWLLIVALTVSVGASLLHGKDYTKPPPNTFISQGQ